MRALINGIIASMIISTFAIPGCQKKTSTEGDNGERKVETKPEMIVKTGEAPVSGEESVHSPLEGKIVINPGAPEFKENIEDYGGIVKPEYWCFSTDIYIRNNSDEVIEDIYFFTKVTKEVCFGKNIYEDFRGEGGKAVCGTSEPELMVLTEDYDVEPIGEKPAVIKPGGSDEVSVTLYKIRKGEAEEYEWTSAKVGLYYELKLLGVKSKTPPVFIRTFEVKR